MHTGQREKERERESVRVCLCQSSRRTQFTLFALGLEPLNTGLTVRPSFL